MNTIEFERMVMDLGINVSGLGPYLAELRYFAKTIADGEEM